MSYRFLYSSRGIKKFGTDGQSVEAGVSLVYYNNIFLILTNKKKLKKIVDFYYKNAILKT